MRVQVVIGVDFKGHLNYQKIADATQEPFHINTYPTSGDGWVFWEFGKGTPDWGWGDYTFTVGTVEVGRHEVTGRILTSEDVESYLINAYERFSEEVSETEEGT